MKLPAWYFKALAFITGCKHGDWIIMSDWIEGGVREVFSNCAYCGVGKLVVTPHEEK